MNNPTLIQFFENNIGLTKTPFFKHDDIEYGYEVFDASGKRVHKIWYTPRDQADQKDAYRKAIMLVKSLKNKDE